MSVICSKVYEDKIVLAADSIMVRGWSKEPSNKHFSKIEEINGMIIGGCGKAEELSLMFQFAVTHKPVEATTRSVLEFVIEFCKHKQEIAKEYDLYNDYLIAYKGEVFCIQRMFVTHIEDFMAIGAGEDFANAALYLGHDAEKAAKTACDLSCMVSEPVIVKEMSR